MTTASLLTRPQDFAGRTIRVAPNIVLTLRTMMARVGVSPDHRLNLIFPEDDGVPPWR